MIPPSNPTSLAVLTSKEADPINKDGSITPSDQSIRPFGKGPDDDLYGPDEATRVAALRNYLAIQLSSYAAVHLATLPPRATLPPSHLAT